jgi:hypothetical protein
MNERSEMIARTTAFSIWIETQLENHRDCGHDAHYIVIQDKKPGVTHSLDVGMVLIETFTKAEARHGLLRTKWNRVFAKLLTALDKEPKL